MTRVFLWAAALALLAISVGGCGELPASASVRGVRVVAAENFWGSIARQLGGRRATVTSIISSPAQDPHAYEPTAADARTLAEARLAVVNGVGYDPWASRLLAANPADARTVLNVGTLLRLHPGDNPHRWYDPADVERVAGSLAAAFGRLDPGHADYYAQRLRAWQTGSLARYHALIAAIRRRYAGVAIGASESIFALQAPALGLRLLTPRGFMRAVTEGTEVTAADTAATERQITARGVRVWIVNRQNLTPEVQRLDGFARAAGIPIVTVTETLSPAGASFEQWQTRQLAALASALHRVTGR
ncbi:MAG: metal ABC transporter solute-binding protein, Zn/Mn family [Solirubrobacteraceae bacterium]